ncbi:stromal cell-derived factor 1 isoform X1 [Bubalus bubalis]|uniref:stromal cell-derived factor 1 isoform X1 n=1 Tax=Bubalus bubalis TaxID=89462 RepID=UPI001D126E5E|nr:stromal cell-derived factor 1 isoform X1 [Bubalus bubalis]
MDAKVFVVLALVLTALCLSDAKPVSLSYRCPCRFFESHVAKANVKHLKILNTPNCSLQIVARLKNNNRQVCIDPKLKWIQEYLDKALNKQQCSQDCAFICAPEATLTQPHSLGPDLCPGNRPGRDYCRRHQWELRTTEVCSLEP